jgi:PEP-CTERM motif
MKKMILAASVAALALAAPANAAVVNFSGSPATSFADGTFTNNLSGSFPDGFYQIDATTAFNGYGQNGLSIIFNAPTVLNSLKIAKCRFCQDANPGSYIVSLFSAASNLLASQSVTPTSGYQTLTFNTAGVKSVVFNFTGGDPIGYGDGRTVAWYETSAVTYGGAAVPEPAAWALMLAGFGLTGAAMRRRQKVQVSYA